MEIKEQRIKLDMHGGVTPCGEFEILAITAGEGNGWRFNADVLKRSLPLWEGVECFVDHSAWLREPRSVRDLGGMIHDPHWDEARQGIRVRLRTLGPSGALVSSFGREILAAGNPAPAIGFSADITFAARGSEAAEISKVHSVDLVYQPARGGAFVKRLDSSKLSQSISYPLKGENMEQNINNEVSAMTEEVQPARCQMQEENESARQSRAVLCSMLLESSLAAAGLPGALNENLRARFAGRVFEAGELTRAIADGRKLVSELTGGAAVHGPGHIEAMYDARDQLQAAVDDLFDAPRDEKLAGLKTHRLSGIRELYLTLTGDHDLHGGYYPERVQLATSADFTGLVKNAMNKLVVNRWNELGRAGYAWWENICTVEHFNSLQQITGTLVGTIESLPVVAEQGEYTELAVGDSPETGSWVKYGGYIPLTLELIDRDETRKLKAYPRELASAGLRNISRLVAAIFTANSGVGPTLADGGALFNNTAVTTAGGHKNLLTAALSASAWDTISAAVYDQPMLVKNASGHYGAGPKLAVNPRYLLTPRALQLTAMKILYPTLENAANIYSENMQRGQPGDVLTVPEWTDPTDWAAVCDPKIAPAIFIGERFGLLPEVFLAGDELSPAVFANDEHRLKVRHFLALWVNDYRPLHKCNVAG
jgi:hypothetical protein